MSICKPQLHYFISTTYIYRHTCYLYVYIRIHRTERAKRKMGSLKQMFLTLFLLIVISQAANADKVTMSLYYESLCPFCSDFIANKLGIIYDTDLKTIVNLRLIPWGNTQRVNNTWICQHGRLECALNIVEACAINVWPQPEVHFRFIQCIEKIVSQGKTEWKTCYKTLNLSPKTHSKCYTTKSGTDIISKYADETDHLNPPHQYVPWVVVNNQPLLADYRNFIAYICKAYKGNNKPKSCQSRVMISSVEEANATDHVCYK